MSVQWNWVDVLQEAEQARLPVIVRVPDPMTVAEDSACTLVSAAKDKRA